MVFHSTSETDSLPGGNTVRSASKLEMASPGLKSQPLHNFSLPDLKWAMNHTNNHRFRKVADSAHKSPQRDAGSQSDNRRGNQPPHVAKNGASASSSDQKADKLEKKKVINASSLLDEKLERKTATPEGRSKILIRFGGKNQKSSDEVLEAGDQTSNTDEAEELVPKTWNLRPRRPLLKAPNAGGALPKIGGAAAPEIRTQRPELSRLRNVTEGKTSDKKEKPKKQKFSISLSREEIDDDVFAMTGSKPSRRPKKRAKNVQKQLECLFPGMWLGTITPDSYKVPDPPLKI